MSWFRRAKERVEDEIDDLADEGDRFEVQVNEKDNFFKRLFGDLSAASVSKQIAVGAIVGGISGFLCYHFGRVAALTVGVGLILIQVAHHQGWITVNWGQVDRRVRRAKRKLQRNTGNWNRFANSVELFLRENMFIATAFAGGFLIGIAAH